MQYFNCNDDVAKEVIFVADAELQEKLDEEQPASDYVHLQLTELEIGLEEEIERHRRHLAESKLNFRKCYKETVEYLRNSPRGSPWYIKLGSPFEHQIEEIPLYVDWIRHYCGFDVENEPELPYVRYSDPFDYMRALRDLGSGVSGVSCENYRRADALGG